MESYCLHTVTVWTFRVKEQAEGGSTMCRQDGNTARWHLLLETARWSAEAGGSFLLQGQWTSEELPTSAAELEIKVVAIQAGEAVVEDTAPAWHVLFEATGWSAEAGGSFLLLGQWTSEELPTSAAELEIKVVAIQAGEAVVEDTAPPGRQHGTAR
jgi:hypothetical protein